MAKPAFPVPYRNLIHFVYQLKNILWASVSQTAQPQSVSQPYLAGQTAPGVHWIWRHHTKRVFSSSLCLLFLRPDHQIWSLTGEGLTWDIRHVPDSFKSSCWRKNTSQHWFELLWSSWRETLCQPSVSIPKLRKKTADHESAERGTSISLPAHYTEPLFLPTVIAKMAELQGHVFCWRPYHESFD